MCLYPKLIKNRKYSANKKNGGVVPVVPDERVKYVPVGCGNCMECRKQKAREWQVRLLEDIKTNKTGKFITLTFSDESIANIYEQIEIYCHKKKVPNPIGYDADNWIATYAVRHFLERWRKKHKKSLRHWLVTELGHNGTENLHLHGIIWTNETYKEIQQHWQYGHIWPTEKEEKNNYVNEKTIAYITKYVNKTDEINTQYKSIILTTDGIGKNYTNTQDAIGNKYKEKNTRETYRTTTGHKIAMPTYWRNKIYTEEEREQLWLQKLDKEIRYINGQPIKIRNKKEIEAYYATLKDAQTRNTRLGYGNDEKNWEQKQYEEEHRKMRQKERIENNNKKKNKNENKKSVP